MKNMLTTIIAAMKKADALYLATDPDREGEAISWHIYTILKDKKALRKKPVHRIVFHEITKTAVQAAVANPREISMDLVNAQQASRALIIWSDLIYHHYCGKKFAMACQPAVYKVPPCE